MLTLDLDDVILITTASQSAANCFDGSAMSVGNATGRSTSTLNVTV